MRFSIIICTYNRNDYLIKVLNCLRDQTFNPTDFEIVVINNNSTDETEKTCKYFSENNTNLNFIYSIEKNKGLSYARNKGINLAIGEWVIFLDDDAEPIKNYLENISKYLKDFPDCIAAGGRIYPKYESKEPKWMSKFLLPLVSAIDMGDKPKKFPSNKYPIGANMLFNRNIFNQIGHFNTALGRKGNQLLGGEEKEIFMKLRKINDNIYYIPNAIVYHFVPDKRLKLDFIKNLAHKIGESNRIIYKDLAISKLIIKEFIKWIASLVLFISYFFTFNFQKGIMLLKFRFWVLRGILSS